MTGEFMNHVQYCERRGAARRDMDKLTHSGPIHLSFTLINYDNIFSIYQ